MISGGPGVGKSALAVHAARRLAPSFPDGQVHVELGTYSPGRRRMDPEEALSALLRAFGEPSASIPRDLPGLVSAWRTLLSGRRAVIVLDDAADVEQVRPLLPGASPSAVLVTSRHRLAGLPGARSLLLDDLSAEGAVALFRQLVGEERAADAAGIRRIAELCAYLPLAVEIAAGRLASRPSWNTGHLLSRLDREQGRLGEIRNGHVEITGAFAMSVNALPAPQRRAFRLLSSHFGRAFDAYAAAALTGLSPEAAERVLEELLDAHLIREPEPDRYTFHDLLKEYSKTLTESEDPSRERTEATNRLIVFYVRTCALAHSMVYPHHPRPTGAGRIDSSVAMPVWNDAEHAKQWLLDEYEALTAAEREARESGDGHSAALLAHALVDFLEEEGHFAAARVMHAAAAEHWRRVDDRAAEARALVDLSRAQNSASLYGEALASGRRALETARSAGSRQTATEALHWLGVTYWNLGRYEEARTYQEETLARRREEGGTWQISRSLNNLGITYLYLCNYETAERAFDEALAGFRSSNDPKEIKRTLNNLCNLYMETGRNLAARRILEDQLNHLIARGDEIERARVMVNLADTMDSATELPAQLHLYEQSLKTFTRIDDRRNAAITLNRMGMARHEAGDHGRALIHHTNALRLAREIGAQLEECRALSGCGAAELGLGGRGAAAHYLDEAMTVAEAMAAPQEKARIEETLALLRNGCGSATGAPRT
ncbi:tetratricopeptide repeat protein [Streptomyces sp. 8L]|uniref:tetratricopeptide repeat protein n=1 Tax=Streptomyces sp. 8L TaxID=2877242 RepID=UPI001CD3C91A|nr:tetratricopeptide repeat protein [Streptomyces sp. 8L]MCA1220601.1 tetratricopeptide repeat protein [Streptomyces sp. 8L]